MVDPGEKITDIDIRPSTGWLYGRSDHGRIYVINAQTGDVAPVSGQVAGGASVATAFNPLTDQLQFDNFLGGSTVIDPNTGAIVSGGLSSFLGGDVFQGLTPRLAGVAFANTMPGLAAQLFGIDNVTNTLVTAPASPNVGPVGTVGSLGIDVTNVVGFDIDPVTGLAFATFQPAGGRSSFLSTVNLATGAASVLGPVGPAAPLILDIAVVPNAPSAGSSLPAAINPTQAGFTTTNLGATIFGPTGLNSGILSGVSPAFVSNFINGINGSTIASVDPVVLSGLSTAINTGLIQGLSPSLVSGFNTTLANFNTTTGLNQGLLGQSGLGTGLPGLTPTTGLAGLTPAFTSGFPGSTFGSGLIGGGVNTGTFGSTGSLLGTFAGVPTAPLNTSLIQPLSPMLAGSSIFSPGPQFGFGVPVFSGL